MIEKEFRTKGTCSRAIYVKIDDEGIIRDAEFEGGCPGNLSGIGKLVLGRRAEEVADLLRGMPCGPRATSCPDQFSRALDEMLAESRRARSA